MSLFISHYISLYDISGGFLPVLFQCLLSLWRWPNWCNRSQRMKEEKLSRQGVQYEMSGVCLVLWWKRRISLWCFGRKTTFIADSWVSDGLLLYVKTEYAKINGNVSVQLCISRQHVPFSLEKSYLDLKNNICLVWFRALFAQSREREGQGHHYFPPRFLHQDSWELLSKTVTSFI